MSLYRNTVWYLKGLREYTKQGYERAEKSFNPSDLSVDCSKKIFLVTGANSGLGYQCALELAKRQGIVHMVCRNAETAKKAQEEIMEQTDNNQVYLHIVDLSDTRQVEIFTAHFTDHTSHLDVIINNAGCLINERKFVNGLDINFATNTLGYYLMTVGLLGALSKSSDPRAILVSSAGMLLQTLDYKDMNFKQMTKYNGLMAYAQNKRQQVVLAEEFAKTNEAIFFASMHPGWVDTPGVRTALPEFFEKMKDSLRTPCQGADTIIWLAISSQATKFPSGSFFQDRMPVSKHLPLAWTNSSLAEHEEFMSTLATTALNISTTSSI